MRHATFIDLLWIGVAVVGAEHLPTWDAFMLFALAVIGAAAHHDCLMA